MYDLLSFGEAMIRLSPPGHLRLEQTASLDVAVGGAELSVAAGVARLGLRSAWVSRLPDNPLGRMISDKGREFGVDVSHVLWAEGERAGLYFVEHGAAPRPTRVIYDRKDSALARIRPGMLDWDALLAGTRVLHVSGITPALSESAAETQKEAMRAARRAGCLVSYDLNYRALLWTIEDASAARWLGFEYVPLDRLLAESDAVSLHVRLSDATRHLMDAERLARMKPGAILINTSRGAVVDTAALIAALRSGHLGGAGLDVLEDERATYHDFSGCNVVVTPHVGWYTDGAVERILRVTLENIAAYLRGEIINRVA